MLAFAVDDGDNVDSAEVDVVGGAEEVEGEIVNETDKDVGDVNEDTVDDAVAGDVAV